MSKFTVTAPDGKEYEVNAPEGATHEDAVNHVKQTYYSSQQISNGEELARNGGNLAWDGGGIAGKSANPEISRKKFSDKNSALADKLLNSPIGGFLRGLRDPIDAGAQMLTRGLEAVAPAGSDFERYMQEQRQNVEGINQQAEQDYKQNWRQGEDLGMIDTGRVAGNIAGTLPIAAAVPGAAATSTLGRVGYGAGLGAVSGALQPVDAPQSDFAEQKAQQVGIGAAFGAVSPFIADAIGKAVGGMSNRLKAAFTPQQAQELNQKITGEFSSRGVDFNRISEETRKSILDDVANALKAGKDLDYDSLAMKASFEKVGIQPTLGQLTRDPMQYQFEQNTRGLQGAGEQLAQRFNDQNKGLVKNVSDLASNAADSYDANVALQKSLKNIANNMKDESSKYYNEARKKLGYYANIDRHKFTENLGKALEREGLQHALPKEVQADINKIARGDAPFRMNEAEQLRNLINNQYDPMGGAVNKAIRLANEHLDYAIKATAQREANQLGTNFVGDAAEKFAKGKSLYRSYKQTLEKTPALEQALKNDIPDANFIEKFVISKTAKPGELLNLRAQLNKHNPGQWEEIRNQVLGFIRHEATGGKSEEFAKFTQSGMDKALKRISDAKMKILFSPDEISQIKTILKVGQAIQIPPVGAAVNTSNTSQAIANLLNRASGIPYLKELAVNPIKNFVVQGQVNSALNPAIKPTASPTQIDPELIRRLMMPIALSGAPMMQQR